MFPTTLSDIKDNETDLMAAHINNLEKKVGINGSLDSSSLDYQVNALGGRATAVENRVTTLENSQPATMKIGETPSGVLDGTNKVFTTAFAFMPSTIDVFRNGVRQTLGVEYAETNSTTITFTAAPKTTDTLRVTYNRSGNTAGDADTLGGKTIIDIMKMLYPVGTVYTNESNSTNPATLFGFGTWVAIQGEVVVGYKSGNTYFGTAGASVGEETHLLTGAESGVAPHTHAFTNGNVPGQASAQWYYTGSFSSWKTVGAQDQYASIANAVSANASQAHNNVQPSHVCYVWRRTA